MESKEIYEKIPGAAGEISLSYRYLLSMNVVNLEMTFMKL